MRQLTFISIFLIAVFAASSCKKDKQPSKQLLLSKVFQDALLKSEYIYSSDRKPIRLNMYSTGSGQSKLSVFRLYQYTTDGLLDEITIFTAANNQFNNKYKLQYDANKRITRMDDLSSDNSVQTYYLFDYNAQGHLAKYIAYNATTSKKVGEGVYGYNQDNLEKINRYIYSLNNPILYDSTTYVFGANKFPSHWKHFEIFLPIALPNGDRTFYEMFYESYFHYFVDAPPATTDATLSGRAYNAAGYLTQQHILLESKFLGATTSTTHDMTYEYIE